MYEEINEKNQELEEWLLKQPLSLFPSCGSSELSYPNKYIELKRKLEPLHAIVEKMALLKSVDDWKIKISENINNLKSKISLSQNDFNTFEKMLQNDTFVYLNQHGLGHIEKIIEHINRILHFFRDEDKLTPFEIFLLLCAIQFHDIGNYIGREHHEREVYKIIIENAESIIKDTPTKRLIGKIAQVHSGKINGDPDTITKSNLQISGRLLGKDVRECLLAALLRFADELADDTSRADIQALKENRIPVGSIIHHEYSNSLQSVKIDKNRVNNTLFIQLDFFIDSITIFKKFIKDNKKILLIDEIFNRSIKFEKERRYCMRFFSQYIHINEIKVRIEIGAQYDLEDSEIISYTLSEYGYPIEKIIIDHPDNTGKKVLKKLAEKGWKLK
jgi:hypothetical protein